MRLAIMQPYFFPYIGYFQLISAVDKFIYLDDVNFIKQGWINRNRILISNKDQIVTLPVKNISSYSTIKTTAIHNYDVWKNKFLKTIRFNYKSAPFYNQILELLIGLLNRHYVTISDFNKSTVSEICIYLELRTHLTDNLYSNHNLKSGKRIIDICVHENATEYINAIGGKTLYSKSEFEKCNIKLSFLQSRQIIYQQFNNKFIPNLSIIDVLMFNEPRLIKHQLLVDYDLI